MKIPRFVFVCVFIARRYLPRQMQIIAFQNKFLYWRKRMWADGRDARLPRGSPGRGQEKFNEKYFRYCIRTHPPTHFRIPLISGIRINFSKEKKRNKLRPRNRCTSIVFLSCTKKIYTHKKTHRRPRFWKREPFDLKILRPSLQQPSNERVNNFFK